MENLQKPPLIVIAGPTGVGKTKLSIALAKAVEGEIISADSMQVYRGMDIGTAKIKKEEMKGVLHHLIDIIEPWEEFSVALFQKLANEAIHSVYSRGKIPILAGGTGFYIQSVTNGIDFTKTQVNQSYRKELEMFAKEQGAMALHKMLEQADPEAARQIHANNIKRTIRALEFFNQTGGQISEHNKEQKRRASPYALYYFVLDAPREILYRDIDRRVDKMMESGLLEEVVRLSQAGCKREFVSMQGLGYKELFAFLENEITKEEAVDRIKRDTRHFAKRQITWFKREEQAEWIRKDMFDYKEDAILQHILKRLMQGGIKCKNPHPCHLPEAVILSQKMDSY